MQLNKNYKVYILLKPHVKVVLRGKRKFISFPDLNFH